MKKAKKALDELRSEYQRSDFGKLVRGKYAARLAKATNVIVLEPRVARVFPNDKAVNEALLGLIKVAEAARAPRRSRTRAKAPHGAQVSVPSEAPAHVPERSRKG